MRIKNLVSQQREAESQDKILQYIREKLNECITDEIASVSAYIGTVKMNYSNLFYPVFAFSEQSIPVFGVAVQQSRSKRPELYRDKLICMQTSLLPNDESITNKEEFIAMTRELLKMMKPCRKKMTDEIETLIGQLNGYAQHSEEQVLHEVNQNPPQEKKVKKVKFLMDDIIGGFDLRQLHRDIGLEIARLKGIYQGDTVLRLDALEIKLKTYPENDDTVLIANFLSGVVSLYSDYPDANRSILKLNYKKDFARTYSDEVAEKLCLNLLDLLARKYVEKKRVEEKRVKSNAGMSTIQLFHSRREDARRASLSKTPPEKSDTPPPSQINLAPPKTDDANHFSRRYS